MLKQIEIIRQVLASASRAKLPMAQEAMDALVSINTGMIELEGLIPAIAQAVEKEAENYNQGGGNFHG